MVRFITKPDHSGCMKGARHPEWAGNHLQTGEDMIEVEVLRGMAGLEKIRKEWHSLLNQHPRPRFFHFYEWWQAYLKALEPAPDSVHFILFRDRHTPVAIVPLKHRVWRLFGLPVRE